MFEHLLVRQDPLAALILKGHLLLEQLLTKFLDERVFHNPSGIARADLRFAQLVELCRAFVPQAEVAALWDLIAKVNTLRNDLGHALETPKRKSLLNDIRHAYGKMIKRTSPAHLDRSSSDEDMLRTTFVLFSGTLVKMTHPNDPIPDVDAIVKDLRQA